MKNQYACSKVTVLAFGAFLAIGGIAQADDVMAKAYFWARGLGEDANGDGVFTKDEFRDALGRTDFTGDAAVRVSSYNAGVALTHTNVVGELPARGVKRTVHGIYLPQKTTITNQETGEGNGTPGLISFNAKQVAAIAANPKHYAVYIRFRPDADQPTPDGTSIFNLGASGNNGIWARFGAIEDTPTGSIWQYGSFSNRTAKLIMKYAQNNTFAEEANMRVGIDVWNDLVVSVDGQTLTCLLSRGGDFYKNERADVNEVVNGGNTWYRSWTVGDTFDLTPLPTGQFVIGGYSTTPNDNHNIGYNRGNTLTATQRYWWNLRGVVQTFAVWTNSLSLAEMREVAAHPRTDRWRVGVEDGTAGEFAAATAGATVDVESDRWAVPTLGAGETVSFRFPVVTAEDGTAGEILRFKLADDSASGTIEAKINGVSLGSEAVAPGRYVRYFVARKHLLFDADNVVRLVRTDGGTGRISLDTVRFGGTQQYGLEDGSAYEFAPEQKAQLGETFDAACGNWRDGRICFYGGTAPLINSAYSQKIIFRLPPDVKNWRRLKLSWKMLDVTPLEVTLNDQSVGTFGDAEQSIRISQDQLAEDGVYTVRFYNPALSTRENLHVARFDYVRLEVQDDKGMVLLFR